MGVPAVDRRQVGRDAAVASLERRLPHARREMLAIVVATGLIGFAVSAGLLGAGETSMARRYATATFVAYAAFVLLVRHWAGRRARGLGASTPSDAFRASQPEPAVPTPDDESLYLADRASADAVLWHYRRTLAVLAVIGSGLVAAAWVVWIAPALLAEVLLDAGLVAGLYGTLHSIEARSWLGTTLRRTWRSAVVIVVFMAAFGFVVQTVMPEVDSIGDVPRAMTTVR
jgi:hypothetical protein